MAGTVSVISSAQRMLQWPPPAAIGPKLAHGAALMVAAATLATATVQDGLVFRQPGSSSVLFNAADYGAVDDGQTDNTPAFARCMHDLVAAGGGRMFLPRSNLGIYRGSIVVPPSPAWITVEISGAVQPTPVFGTVGRARFCANCSHIVVQSVN
eukprot:SAG31_NODE_8716_length_1400_cov_1.278248_2_plen_154_part_00